jgi:hypothetical protein
MNEKSPTRAAAMGRANRTTAKSALAAAVVMVMALAAFLGTTKPALAATASRTAGQGANAATARLSSVAGNPECIISSAHNECASTNRELYVDSGNPGNTDDCTFTWKMYWGDGTTETVTDPGGDSPFLPKALHFYKEPKETTTYYVNWDAVSVTGGCGIESGYGYFILVVPPS